LLHYFWDCEKIVKQTRFRNAPLLKRNRKVPLSAIRKYGGVLGLEGKISPEVAKEVMTKIRRDEIARGIRAHRQRHFFTELDAKAHGYTRNRTLLSMATTEGVDLEPILRQRLNRFRKTRILHAGAGHLALDESIKQTFGKKVWITSLNIIHPKPIQRPGLIKQKRLTDIYQKHASRKINILTAESLIEQTKAAERIRQETMGRAKAVDEIRVSSGERFKTKKRFGLILDIFGPLYYSKYPEEVMQSYVEALEENGEIIVNGDSAKEYKLEREYPDPKTGKKYSLQTTPLDKFGRLWSIRKVLKNN